MPSCFKDPYSVFGKYLRRQVRNLHKYLPKVPTGKDEEAVHQTRVACRRLRVALRNLREILPAKLTKGRRVGKLRQEIRSLARSLGEVRDKDVQLQRFKTWSKEGIERAEKPGVRRFLALIRRSRREALRAARVAVAQFRRSKAISRLNGWIRNLLDTKARKKEVLQLAAEGRRFLGEKLARVLSFVENPQARQSSEELHAFRISVKQLRYAFELWEAFNPDQFKTPLDECRKLQEILGEICDSFVAAQLVRASWEKVVGESQTDAGLAEKWKPGFQRCEFWCEQRREEALRRLEAFLQEASATELWKTMEKCLDLHSALRLSPKQAI